jgi:protein TonB
MVRALIAIGALAVLAVLVWYVRSVVANKPQSGKRQVAIAIKIIRPPEPPPEPPPPPPPEKVEEQIPQDKPEDKPVEQAPESAQLGVDAEGAGGGDSFGLVGHAGGRDLIGSGNGPFVFYASLVKDLVQDALSGVDRIRRSKYSVNVRVWISSDGRIERASLVDSTGNHELDGMIEKTLSQSGKVREAPPLEMPQPITLKIVSRG